MTAVDRINFFEDLGEKKATIAYFLQEGLRTCNASCKGCYAGAGQTSFKFIRGIVKPDEAERDITELIKYFRVFLRGTEILINPQYIPLLSLAENNIVLTNGIVLGKFPERLDLLADNGVTNIVVTFPFKGAPATTRNLSDLLNQRDITLSGIKYIRQHHFPFTLQLSAIVTKDCNTIGLTRICDEAIKLGADVLRIIPYVPMSGVTEIDQYSLSNKERASLVEQVTRLKQIYGRSLIIHTPGVLGLFPLRAKMKEKTTPDFKAVDEQLICPAGTSYFAIRAIRKNDSSGTLYKPVTPCHFRMDAEIGKYYGGLDLRINQLKVERLFKGADRTDCLAQNYWGSRTG